MISLKYTEFYRLKLRKLLLSLTKTISLKYTEFLSFEAGVAHQRGSQGIKRSDEKGTEEVKKKMTEVNDQRVRRMTKREMKSQNQVVL